MLLLCAVFILKRNDIDIEEMVDALNVKFKHINDKC